MPEVPEHVALAGQPRMHDTVMAGLRESVRKSRGRPQAAVLAVLELHAAAGDQAVCEADGLAWSCATVEAVHSVYGVQAAVA